MVKKRKRKRKKKKKKTKRKENGKTFFLAPTRTMTNRFIWFLIDAFTTPSKCGERERG
jgi:hypothetical protein